MVSRIAERCVSAIQNSCLALPASLMSSSLCVFVRYHSVRFALLLATLRVPL